MKKRPAVTQTAHTQLCPLTTNKEGGPVVGSQIQAFLTVACDHRLKIHVGITEEMQNPRSLMSHRITSMHRI